MKHVLLNLDNRVVQVVDTLADTFEVHNSLTWRECSDDDVEQNWDYKPDSNTFENVHAIWAATAAGQRATMIDNRKEAYGLYGDQLDAIYRDMRDGTSKYVDHITAVKAKYSHVESVDLADKDSVLDSE